MRSVWGSSTVSGWNFRSAPETIKAKLGIRAKGRRISGMNAESNLREPQASYSYDFHA
jgi:hypothetical protein